MTTFLFLLLLGVVRTTEALPLLSEQGLPDDVAVSPGPDWTSGLLVAAAGLIVLITLLALCSDGCFKIPLPKIHWFGRSPTRVEVPLSFDNPVADLNLPANSMPLSQIDVRALEVNPVVFEPLPTIHDLSPLPAGQGDGPSGLPDPAGALLSAKGSGLVPFATEDSELFAHDWFDEPYQNFQRKNLEFIRELGRGWFGEVLEAEARDIVPYANKIRVVVKRLKEEATQIEQMRFLDEARVYRDAKQGNVLKLLGHSIERLPFLLILEHWPQGDLKSYLISSVTRAEQLSKEGVILSMALDIAKGLEYLHSSSYKHSDLAARNCQVATDNRVVIGDFGLAVRAFKDDYFWSSGVPIPIRWAAPETVHTTANTIQTLKVTQASNIWSFGVVLWEILEFGKLPYFELSDEDVITRVLGEKSYFLGQPTLPYIPFKEELYKVMLNCWSISPQRRPTMKDVVGVLRPLKESSRDTKEEGFESKWERLGRNSVSSSNSSPTKKTVSFSVAEDLKGSLEREEEEREEEKWMAEVSQKVMEKSQSAQNFMVLTHVEPQDMHGPESLMEVQMREPDTLGNGTGINPNSDFSTSSDAKEPGSSSRNSEQVPSTNSLLMPPSIEIQPSTPGTTPNRTGIDISVTEPTPVKTVETISDASLSARTEDDVMLGRSPGSPPTPRGVRNGRRASTPKRSENDKPPSPFPFENGNGSHTNSGVFDDEEEEEDESKEEVDYSCNESPISMKVGSIPAGQLITTIVGASDDLGLGVFEGVTSTSELIDKRYEESQSDDEISSLPTTRGGGVAGTPQKTTEIKPRVLFEISTGSTEPDWSQVSVPVPNGESATTSTTKSSSWDNVSLHDVQKPSENGSKATANDDEEFLARQMQSLMSATKDTQSLLAMAGAGLTSAKIATPTYFEGDQFFQDISQAQEDMGSLVLEDLENEGTSHVVIAPSVPADQVDSFGSPVKPKFAFGESSSTPSIEGCSDRVQTAVEEFKATEESNSPCTSPNSGPSSLVQTEFVPSMWNQNLAPARPAIKSPNTSMNKSELDASTASSSAGMKKSVSFERKKKQLVYQYPPPPPTSDSEEEICKLQASKPITTIPFHESLDWDLSQEDLEFAQVNPSGGDSDEEAPVKPDPMDMYRISGFEFPETSFQIRSSEEPFEFQPSTLGQLRHTRDKLKLDLNKCKESGNPSAENKDEEEDSVETEEIKSDNVNAAPSEKLLDSGVGSSSRDPSPPHFPQ